MVLPTMTVSTAADGESAHRRAAERPGLRVRGSLLGLGLAGAMAWGAGGARAQSSDSERLTVRPHEMATGTENTQAGEQVLDGIANTLIYVPAKAVGTRRVPLVVFLHGGGTNAESEMEIHRPVADKYGIIAMAPDITTATQVDTALKLALQKFAIDPDRVALVGMSLGGDKAYTMGCRNADLFSRVVPISSVYVVYPCRGVHAPTNGARFLLATGIQESPEYELSFARQLRQDGYTIELPVVTMRTHMQRSQDYDFVLGWLQRSWAAADPPPLTAPIVASVPELTTEAIARMRAFWIDLLKEPDSVHQVGRVTYGKPVTLDIGQEQMIVSDMLDMPGFAANVPSVAAALRAAELSADQEQAYRAAIISAVVTSHVDRMGAVPATSVLGKNVAFFKAHEPEVAYVFDSMSWISDELRKRKREYLECLQTPNPWDC